MIHSVKSNLCECAPTLEEFCFSDKFLCADKKKKTSIYKKSFNFHQFEEELFCAKNIAATVELTHTTQPLCFAKKR
jgi:hypothetical protein